MIHIKSYETLKNESIKDYIIYTTIGYDQNSKDHTKEILMLSELLSNNPVKVSKIKTISEFPMFIPINKIGNITTYSMNYELNILYSSNSLEDANEEFEKLKQIYINKWEIKKNSSKFNL